MAILNVHSIYYYFLIQFKRVSGIVRVPITLSYPIKLGGLAFSQLSDPAPIFVFVGDAVALFPVEQLAPVKSYLNI
ncbi:MAG: hypothetical protein EZS28_043381 [Streblomastix strix]|uniref:Uncharacterized protein n=1 Tax=Streblomastix strix TaxID=222440 RepID=A0A5J4TT45_9EUKA|nr:MAG: hypothetical protein EZS28_043381 [Streblomastix strix]